MIPTPPKEMRHGAGAKYAPVGRSWLRFLTSSLGGLQPHERVLDAGCGVGRMAVPLTGYLDSRGSYEGFDIEPRVIAWCRENITTRYPNFNFQTADIHNTRYNPDGKQQACDFRFPYPDQSFDLVFMASVFTHLLPAEIENYLSETSRVLKYGGRCVISCFLLNEHSLRQIEAGDLHPKRLAFNYDCGDYRLKDKQVPEQAVAHDEHAVRELYRKYGLGIVEPIHYGKWAGGKSRLGVSHNQDMIFAIRSHSAPVE